MLTDSVTNVDTPSTSFLASVTGDSSAVQCSRDADDLFTTDWSALVQQEMKPLLDDVCCLV